MPANVFKDTAGRTLVGFAILVSGVTIATVHDWWTRTDLEWPELPTAVEDTAFFRPPEPAPGGEPPSRLVFWGAPEGIPRSGSQPLTLRDFRMRKLVDPRFAEGRQFTRDGTGEHFVYRYDKDEVSTESGLPGRLFLKAGRDRYVAFQFSGGRAGGGEDSDLQPPGVPVTPSGHSDS
jgi:hypothetical protein